MLALVGCATTPSSGPPSDSGEEVAADAHPGTRADAGADGSTEPEEELPEVGLGPSLLKRAQSAMEGAVLGAVIGAQAGPIGAAVGAGTLLIYGAITGHVPLAGASGSRGGGKSEEDREKDMEDEMQREERRGDDLEDEIEAELARQEDLLRQIESEEHPTASGSARAPGDPAAPSRASLSERANPRAAPYAPKDRELPLAIFDEAHTTIPRGAWENKRKLLVVRRSLDADMDGKPEQIRYFDEKTGEMIRKEQDVDYDGDLDTWSTYVGEKLVARQIDTNADGRPDVWESYEQLRMTSREVDRDGDGVRDAFYDFVGDSLVEERHDANGDGAMDTVVTYENRLRVRSEEDRDRDGRMDGFTTYGEFEGEEIVQRVERDTDGSGKPDTFETYSAVDGRAVLAMREEDKNGDGEIDIRSIYENGKLVKREISDPSLVPL